MQPPILILCANISGQALAQSPLPPPLYSQLKASYGINAHGATGPDAKLDALTTEHIAMSGAFRPVGLSTLAPRQAMTQKMHSLEEYVEFGKDFSKYNISPSRVSLHSSDGSQAYGSLLLGTDGAGSNVEKKYIPQLSTIPTDGKSFYGKPTLTPKLEISQLEVLRKLTIVQNQSNNNPTTLIPKPAPSQNNAFRKHLPPDHIYYAFLKCSIYHRYTNTQPP